MLETNKFSVINIRRYLNSDNPKLGESRLLQVLSEFKSLTLWIHQNVHLCY